MSLPHTAEPADRTLRSPTIPIAAKPRITARAFVQSGFNEVAQLRMPRQHVSATSQNPPDSGLGGFVILCCIATSREDEMRPRERRETGEQDLFRSRLDQIIDMKHPLAKLARTVDWGFLEGVLLRRGVLPLREGDAAQLSRLYERG
ncbi:hypothetical protein BjapCC829_48820 (plasmid) [Bradyrhizobium barranii]|uniref:Transposase n=1 Tax=Bradyrhizobium barranii TaxID=2992140 RepID=A0ABY3R2G3_9BRAD|nr:hypothetical protein [Bradyrhizobium japonicum]UFW92173.1 hypothetical protein BjapCC829_48820 [Bradyrhizobium japonicum]